MKILVTGANGQLGNEMRILARESSDRYIFTDVVEHPTEPTQILDITDSESVNRLVDREGIECIVNCAAYTNVDKAESDESLCMKLNADAPQILANAMARVNGLLIHISTDYVFGGEMYNTPCTEDRKGTPTGVYGRTKLEGEKRIMESSCKYVILRTAWLYSEFGKNFVKTMLNLTAEKPELKVVFDQVGTPTYALDLAKGIREVIRDYSRQPYGDFNYAHGGIYHFSNEGVCSWYDFTKEIARMTGHDKCRIMPCHSDEFPSPVKRPAYSVLDKTKFKNTFGMEIPYWTDSLHACLTAMGSNPEKT